MKPAMSYTRVSPAEQGRSGLGLDAPPVAIKSHLEFILGGTDWNNHHRSAWSLPIN